MQVNRKSRRAPLKIFLLFFMAVLLAYLPVSSFLFFLKNDAFNGYFPAKFFISESLLSGHLPLWNPYINFGLPQYGDMNSGFWSPVTWLVAASFGYNAYSFTIELLFYLFTAGTGMFLLCRLYRLKTAVCIIAGTAFMCSGYMVGHLQHFNWIGGAAFLPWCLWAYTRLQKRTTLKNSILTANLFYLFAASAHPGIIVGGIYFFVAYAVFHFFRKKGQDNGPVNALSFVKHNGWMMLILLLLSAGMIAGYMDILPHITRGNKVEMSAAMAHPVTVQSSLSAMLPFSIVKNDSFFATDLSMRNIYFGLTLLLFFFLSLLQRKNGYQRFFLAAGVIFFLLSLGGIFKSFSYRFIPLMAYVRLNGEFAVFALFSFILVAAHAFNNQLEMRKPFSGKLRILYYVIEVLLFIALVTGVYKTVQTHDGFIYHISEALQQTGMAQKLKLLIDSVTFYDALWLQGGMQLLLLRGLKYSLLHHKKRLLIGIGVADLIIATLLNVPFTGVGKASVRDVQLILNKSPDGILIPDLEPILQHTIIPAEETALVGNWSFYNKQLGVTSFAFYPVELKTSALVFPDSISRFAEKPCLFTIQDTGITDISVHSFTGSSIELTLTSNRTDSIVYQQNTYPHWRSNVNGGTTTAAAGYRDIFLAAPLKPGKNFVQFVFEPTLVKNAMMLSALAFCISMILLISMWFKRPSPS